MHGGTSAQNYPISFFWKSTTVANADICDVVGERRKRVLIPVMFSSNIMWIIMVSLNLLGIEEHSLLKSVEELLVGFGVYNRSKLVLRVCPDK